VVKKHLVSIFAKVSDGKEAVAGKENVKALKDPCKYIYSQVFHSLTSL